MLTRVEVSTQANACVAHGFVSDGLRWWVNASNKGHPDALCQLAQAHLEGTGGDRVEADAEITAASRERRFVEETRPRRRR